MVRKRVLGTLLGLVLAVGLTACGTTTEETVEETGTDTSSIVETEITQEESAEEVEEPEVIEVNAAEIFDNAGFYEVEITEDCTIEASLSQVCKDNDIEWTAYVLSEEFDDAPRFIPQAEELLKNTVDIEPDSGAMIAVTAGDYVYFYCSENSFTLTSADEVTDGDTLTYFIEK